MAPPPFLIFFSSLVFLGLPASPVSAGALNTLQDSYNEDVRRLNAERHIEMPGYTPVEPASAVERFALGATPFDSINRLSEFPALGTKVSIRGKLTVSDPEEMSSKAAPERVRLYGAAEAGGEISFVPLDVSRLSSSERAVIAKHCSVLPCPVTVFGRVWEIAAERVTNLFSATGAVTVMIGVVAEQARFQQMRP